MVSTMLALLREFRQRSSIPFNFTLKTNIISRYKGVSFGLLIGIVCLILFSGVVLAQFSVRYASTRLISNVYSLDATLEYKLTDVVAEAVRNGVALTFVLSIEVRRGRWYLWDEKVTTLRQRYQLRYYALSQQYVLKYLNTGIQDTFPNINAALEAMGSLNAFPLLDKHLVRARHSYDVYLQTFLDIEALPPPLRPVAYLSSQWRLTSDWYVCPLQPAP